MFLVTALAAAAVIGQRLPTETDCGGPWIYASACRQAKVLQQPFMCQVCRSWAALDRVLSAHGGNLSSKVSGDLVRRETYAGQAVQLVQAIIKRNGAATVCETGFNAGHSALLFLALPYADARTPRSLRARRTGRVTGLRLPGVRTGVRVVYVTRGTEGSAAYQNPGPCSRVALRPFQRGHAAIY